MDAGQIMQEAKEYEEQIIKTRRHLHKNPETGFDIKNTFEFVKNLKWLAPLLLVFERQPPNRNSHYFKRIVFAFVDIRIAFVLIFFTDALSS